ncbi:tape measure protein [Caulobacter phage Sansa]|uniref:Tape measure protein n=1 Tax=Caulobacter phage Sansa TaxID=1675600 RepID=A0A0K1LLS0_9CAUD|nr:tail length tape measure protein [Caulobacter phage Sansa]AKU43441.1 tape measure protein [Caulobacter phage Sansa]
MVMADFPTLGLNFDLNEIVGATRGLEKAKSAYLELGEASEEAAKEAEAAANRVVTAAKKLARAAGDARSEARGKGGKPAKTAEELQMEAIQKAIGEKSRFWKQKSAEQMAAARAAAAEEAAQLEKTNRLAQDMLNFRIRLTRQRAAEASAAERAVAEAADKAENEIRQNARTTLEFRMRMARQRAAEEEQIERRVVASMQAAHAAAAAEAKIDADVQKALAERNSQFRVDQIKREYAEEEAARARRLADIRSDAEIERRLAERNMDFRAQQIITASAGGGGRGGGLFSNLFGGAGGAGGFNGILGNLNDTVGRVRTSFLNARFAVAAFLGALTVQPIVHVIDSMTALQARVSLYAAKASDVPYTFEALYKSAQDARQPLEGIATLYTRLAPLADQLGKSQRQLLGITKTVAQSFAIGGASAAESASSSQQLAQALAANRLGGDELRSLAENAPVLLQMIAKSLNMNSAQFIKWAHDGKASASVVVNAIEQASGKIDEMFKRFPVTIGQSITLVSNAFAHLVDRVNVATGASTKIATEISKLAEFLDRQSTIDAFSAGVTNFGKALSLVGSVIKGVVDYLPALGAGLLTIAAASAAPTVMSALATAITAVGIASTGAAGRALVFNQAVMASSRGVAALVASLGGMSAIITGGVAVAIALLVAGLVRIRKAQEDAQNAVSNFGDTQQGAISALQRAASFAETYSINTSGLSKALLDVTGASNSAAGASDTATNANKAALEMANARAEAERALTVSILRRAAADAGQNAQKADNSINGFMGIRDQLQIGRRLASPEAIAKAEKQIKDVEGVVQRERDLQQKLEAQANALEKANLTVTVPEGSGKPSGGNTEDPNKGLTGAINRIARMRAEVLGLQNQIRALSADPLSDFSARIIAAGEEAAAQYTAGKATKFGDQARTVAQQKEEASIRLQLTQTMVEQARAQADENAQLAVSTAARQRANAVLTAYWTSGNRTAQGYAEALRQASQAEVTGAVRAEELRIAQQYGVRTIGEISAAYQKATGATKENADALQLQAQKTLAATEATIKNTQAEREAAQAANAALDRTQAIQDLQDYVQALNSGTEALAAYNRQLRLRAALASAGPAANVAGVTRDINDQISAEDAQARAERKKSFEEQLRLASLTAQQREVEAEAMRRVEEAQKRGSQNAQELSISWQRIQVATEQSRLNVAGLAGQTKDAVRNAFIDTGRLNFKPLKDSLTQMLRQSLYDAWLAKPIEIVVDAIVRRTKSGQERLKQQGDQLWDQFKNSDFANGISNTFKNALSKLPEGIKKLFGNGGANLGEFAGNTMAGYGTGAAVADALGIKGSTSHKGWQQAMDIGAAAIGTAIGGPIGGAIATFLSRSLGKAILGKESNHAAIASFDQFGNFTGSLTGDKRTDETIGLATAAATGITNGMKALRELGATLTTTVSKLDIGTRDKTHINFSGGQQIDTAVGDADAAVQGSLLLIARSARFADEGLQRFVDSVENSVTTIDELINKIQAYQQASDFRTSVERSILQYTDPREYALSNLRDTQVARRKQAADYYSQGLYTMDQYSQLQSNLGKLEGMEIKDLLTQLATGVDGAVASLDKLKKAQADLADYLTGLLTSSLSPLSPQEQLQLSGDKFNSLLAKAMGGDLDAFNKITGASDEYLNAAQKFFGSTEAYAAIFDRVYGQLEQLSSKEFEDPLVTAIDEQTQKLIDAINQATGTLVSSLGASAAAATTPTANDVAAAVSGGALSNTQVDQIVTAIKESSNVISDTIAGAAEAQVSATTDGFGGLTDATVDSMGTDVALNGGQVRTKAA